MAGSRYDRTTNITKDPTWSRFLVLPDLLEVLWRWHDWWHRQHNETRGPHANDVMSHLSHADCWPAHIILASLKLASIRKWRGGSHILFLAARGNRQARRTGFEKIRSIEWQQDSPLHSLSSDIIYTEWNKQFELIFAVANLRLLLGVS